MRTFGKGSIASFVNVALTVLWVVLWACGAGLVLYAAAYIYNQVSGRGAAGPSPIVSSELDLKTLFDTPWQSGVPALLIGAVAIGGSLIIIWHLRRLFDSFSSGEPFRKENAQHLRAIWITMLGVELARQALLALTAGLLTASGRAMEFHIRIDLAAWISIFVLIAVAEAFREGARLKEEQELTI